jgi:hypothetical protein
MHTRQHRALRPLTKRSSVPSTNRALTGDGQPSSEAPSPSEENSNGRCEVDSGRPAGISTGGFPRVASRTRRASRPGTGLSTSPVTTAVMVHPVAGHGVGMAVPR